jgi:hypothetical protein
VLQDKNKIKEGEENGCRVDNRMSEEEGERGKRESKPPLHSSFLAE